MNSAETQSLTGAILQIHFMQIVEPWYINTDIASKANTVLENSTVLSPNAFIEYYY